MPVKRRALGRGLDALLPAAEPAAAPEAPSAPIPGADAARAGADAARAVVEMDLDSIIPNPYQPRKAIDEASLAEMAESIRAQGVLQPILLRRIDRRYQIIAGERRWRASRLAGLATVPAIVYELTEREMLEWALLENLQREDLNPIEEARAYQTLGQEFGLSQEEIAQRVGRQRSSVANALRLLKLPEAWQLEIINGALTAGHGRALLAVADPARQRLLHDDILARAWSVRQAEEAANRLASESAGPGRSRRKSADGREEDPQLADLANRLTERLGAKTALHPTGKARGRLEIYYYSLDDLDRIIDRILGADALGR